MCVRKAHNLCVYVCVCVCARKAHNLRPLAVAAPLAKAPRAPWAVLQTVHFFDPTRIHVAEILHALLLWSERMQLCLKAGN